MNDTKITDGIATEDDHVRLHVGLTIQSPGNRPTPGIVVLKDGQPEEVRESYLMGVQDALDLALTLITTSLIARAAAEFGKHLKDEDGLDEQAVRDALLEFSTRLSGGSR